MARIVRKRFVVLHPDYPTFYVFWWKDWQTLCEIVGPFVVDYVVVEYEIEFSRSGKVKWVEVKHISDERYKDVFNSKDVYMELEAQALEMRKLIRLALEAVDKVVVHTEVKPRPFAEAKIFVNGKPAVIIEDRTRYTLAKIYLPEELKVKIENILVEYGYRQGVFGGMIKKGFNMNEFHEIVERIRKVVEDNKDLILKRKQQQIKLARDLLLWVDNWDPSRVLTDDVKRILQT